MSTSAGSSPAQYLLPFQRDDLPDGDFGVERIMVPLDGSALAEQALPVAELLARTVDGRIDLMSVKSGRTEVNGEPAESRSATEVYLNRLAETLRHRGVKADITMRSGNIPEEIGRHGIESNADVIVMATHGRSRVDRHPRSEHRDGGGAADRASGADHPADRRLDQPAHGVQETARLPRRLGGL